MFIQNNPLIHFRGTNSPSLKDASVSTQEGKIPQSIDQAKKSLQAMQVEKQAEIVAFQREIQRKKAEREELLSEVASQRKILSNLQSQHGSILKEIADLAHQYSLYFTKNQMIHFGVHEYPDATYNTRIRHIPSAASGLGLPDLPDARVIENIDRVLGYKLGDKKPKTDSSIPPKKGNIAQRSVSETTPLLESANKDNPISHNDLTFKLNLKISQICASRLKPLEEKIAQVKLKLESLEDQDNVKKLIRKVDPQSESEEIPWYQQAKTAFLNWYFTTDIKK